METNTDMEMKLLLEEKNNTNKEQKEEPDHGNYRDKVKGILLMLLTVVCYISSTVCVQLLQRAIPDFELNGIRFGFGLVCFTLGFLWKKRLPFIPRSEFGSTLTFFVMGFLETVTMYGSASLIPLSYLKSLFFTFMIIGGLILYRIFLGEEINWKRVLFALLCVVGVILSIQPEFIFTCKRRLHEDMINIQPNQTHHNFIADSLNSTHQSSDCFLDVYNTEQSGDSWKRQLYEDMINIQANQSDNNISFESLNSTNTIAPGIYNDKNYFFTILGCVLAIAAGTLETVYVILLKKLPFLSENVLDVLFWDMLFCTLVSLVVMGIFETPVLPTHWTQVIYISIHCVTFIVIDIASLMATCYISGNAMNITWSLAVIISLIPQYTLLSHIMPGNKNWIEVVGSVLVFLGCISGTVVDMMKSKE